MEQINDIKHIAGPDVVCLEGNGARPSHKGPGYKAGGVMFTLNSTEVHCVCYRIGSHYSNSMKSANPHSGIYKTSLSNTLDHMNCGYPACNQGGVAVVEIYKHRVPSG